MFPSLPKRQKLLFGPDDLSVSSTSAVAVSEFFLEEKIKEAEMPPSLLPTEILVHAWRYLAPPDVKRVRAVCKKWNLLCLELFRSSLVYEMRTLEMECIENDDGAESVSLVASSTKLPSQPTHVIGIAEMLRFFEHQSWGRQQQVSENDVRKSALNCRLNRLPEILERVVFKKFAPENADTECLLRMTDGTPGNGILACLAECSLAPDQLRIENLDGQLANLMPTILRFHKNKRGSAAVHCLHMSIRSVPFLCRPTIDDAILAPHLTGLTIVGNVGITMDGVIDWLQNDSSRDRAMKLSIPMRMDEPDAFRRDHIVPVASAWRRLATETMPGGKRAHWHSNRVTLEFTDVGFYRVSGWFQKAAAELKAMFRHCSSAGQHRSMFNDNQFFNPILSTGDTLTMDVEIGQLTLQLVLNS